MPSPVQPVASGQQHTQPLITDPHHLQHLLRPPSTTASHQHVIHHLNTALPKLAAQHPGRPFSPLPSSAALNAHLHHLQHAQCQAQQHHTHAHATLRSQLLASLASVNTLKQSLAHLPAGIAATEDELLELCENLLAASHPASTAPESSRNASESLLARLQQLHDAIDQLKQAKAYFQVLAQAEDLRIAIARQEAAASAASASTDEPNRALVLLAQLHHHVQRCEKLAGPDASRIKAVDFLYAQRDAAFSLLRNARIFTLQQALADNGWPPQAPSRVADKDQHDFTTDSAAAATDASSSRSDRVRKAWSDLCQLQDEAEHLGLMPRATAKPHSRHHRPATGKASAAGSDDYVPLLATQVVIEPLLLRFRYHFDGSRSTNRLDKPEWYLSHVASLIRTHAALFQPPVRGVSGSGGPIARLCRFYANAKPAGVVEGQDDYAVQQRRRAFRYIDTYAELLHGLLTPLRRKLSSSMPSLLEHPSLLAHTVFQALTFDADLREQFPASRSILDNAGTAKLADDILANREWYTRWLEGEKEFALRRFEDVIDAPDAWAIGASDSIAEDDEQLIYAAASRAGQQVGEAASPSSKTTKSARAVIEILESVTERYRPLPSLEQRLSFLAIVQLPILRAYHNRLSKSLDAFESLSSAFARAMPGEISAGLGAAAGVSTGTSDSDMVRGLRGLGRLVKAMLSASYVVDELERWGDTAFFVEMSEDLKGTEGQKLTLGLKKDDEAELDRELDSASLGMLLRRGLKRSNVAARPDVGDAATSTTTSQQASGEDVDKPSGVWEEARRRFNDLVVRATEGMEKLIVSEVLEQLRPYAHRNWNTDEEEEDEGTPTSSLIPSLSILSTHLTHLVAVVEAEKSIRIYRHVASELASVVVERVVMAGGSHRFTQTSSHRFLLDLQQGWLSIPTSISTSTTHLGRNPTAPWKLLKDVATLLSLPPDGQGWTIEKVSNIFHDQREIEKMCLDLGLDIDLLGIHRVRETVRRRVDCWR